MVAWLLPCFWVRGSFGGLEGQDKRGEEREGEEKGSSLQMMTVARENTRVFLDDAEAAQAPKCRN